MEPSDLREAYHAFNTTLALVRIDGTKGFLRLSICEGMAK